jgi:hypothetical protein
MTIFYEGLPYDPLIGRTATAWGAAPSTAVGLAITRDAEGRTFFTRNGQNVIEVLTNGSIIFDRANGPGMMTNDLVEFNANEIGLISFMYTSFRQGIYCRSLVLQDSLNPANITLRRSGNDLLPLHHITKGVAYASVIGQGDHNTTATEGIVSHYHGMQGRVLFSAAEDFVDADHLGNDIYVTTRAVYPLASATLNANGTEVWRWRDDGSIAIAPVKTATPNRPSVTGGLSFYVENRHLKTQDEDAKRRLIPQARYGSATYNPPSLAPGASASVDISCSGTEVGDPLAVGFTQPLQGVIVWACSKVQHEVTVYFYNPTAGTVDLASGTLSVIAFQSLESVPNF